MARTLRQEGAPSAERRGQACPQVVHRQVSVPCHTKPPGRVVRRSPSPCERRTRYPGGFDAGERRTSDGSASMPGWPFLWRDLWIVWGHGGVLLWMTVEHPGDAGPVVPLGRR